MINVESSSSRRRMIVWDKAKDDEMSIAPINEAGAIIVTYEEKIYFGNFQDCKKIWRS